jgi:hypothetical protein
LLGDCALGFRFMRQFTALRTNGLILGITGCYMRQIGAEEGYSRQILMIITPIEKVARIYPREKLFQNAIGTFLNGIGPNFLNVNRVA